MSVCATVGSYGRPTVDRRLTGRRAAGSTGAPSASTGPQLAVALPVPSHARDSHGSRAAHYEPQPPGLGLRLDALGAPTLTLTGLPRCIHTDLRVFAWCIRINSYGPRARPRPTGPRKKRSRQECREQPASSRRKRRSRQEASAAGLGLPLPMAPLYHNSTYN